jgi:hypothetical protein
MPFLLATAQSALCYKSRSTRKRGGVLGFDNAIFRIGAVSTGSIQGTVLTSIHSTTVISLLCRFCHGSGDYDTAVVLGLSSAPLFSGQKGPVSRTAYQCRRTSSDLPLLSLRTKCAGRPPAGQHMHHNFSSAALYPPMGR